MRAWLDLLKFIHFCIGVVYNVVFSVLVSLSNFVATLAGLDPAEFHPGSFNLSWAENELSIHFVGDNACLAVVEGVSKRDLHGFSP